MANRPTSLWIQLEFALYGIVRVIVRPIYAMCFGWWLDGLLARKDQARLAADIRLSLRFLFAEENAEIVPNQGVPFPPSFDYAFVTVALDKFLLRFCRGRDELTVKIAPAFAASDWHDLSLILSFVEGRESIEREPFRNLWHVADRLKPNMKALGEAVSSDQFTTLRQRLESEVYVPERNFTKEYEAKLNWHLYGHRRSDSQR